MTDFAKEVSGDAFIKELLIRDVANQEECLILGRVPIHIQDKMRHDIIAEHKKRAEWCGCWTCNWNHPSRHSLSHGGNCPCTMCEDNRERRDRGEDPRWIKYGLIINLNK